ncbi:MAG: diguanylate cyclase [Sulfurimonas sp.]|uniref:GGDEF domain-containing protein n=1 Tax=Sulfurimonas sp. TaxID=2022749 RepID=UPI0025D12619|nr:diguanylate cyclase [Sulfurimonas sp.]MCK9491475.1 diguanylate cyclase [Sulfurimonas sp.]
MLSQSIASLLCKKSNLSYLIFDQSFNILDFNEELVEMANDKNSLKFSADAREAFWEFIGIEQEITKLFKSHNQKSFEIPMIQKKDIFYNVEVEIYEQNKSKRVLIAYFRKKSEFSLKYANAIQEINKKTLIFQTEQKETSTQKHYYDLINKKLLSFYVDSDGIITQVNDTCSLFFSKDKEMMIGNHFSYFFQTRESNIAQSSVMRAINSEGRETLFHTNIIALQKDEIIYENLIICQDITYIKQVEEELKFAASNDSLTGLINKNGFLKKVDELIHKTDDETLWLCLIDLSDFKSINENYGRHAGDMLLKHLSRLLKSLVRDGDIVARVGVDEFAILFNKIKDEKYLESTINRIHETKDSSPLIYSANDTIVFDFKLTSSCYPKDADDAKNLILESKKLMRLKKQKNRVS